MGTGLTVIVVTALLAAPCGVLVGVAAGAWGAFRLLRGQSPIPPLPLRPAARAAFKDPAAAADAKGDGDAPKLRLPRVGC
jgi:hypothetical protein